ncbi:MAG: hypothetical protein A3F92_11405 [Candidatus Rokubacteria bacterium RIFCSPLOWO2_12_FULL_71_22]|nr:MAG: hypothetical protein A3F92_11405 [Candidatus Rokubacteria bacterium RIFCSPLOWO2_12_FULL_71_22]
MIRQAILYLASPDDARAAQLAIAGRPLAFRAVVAALRAGAARVGVPGTFRGTAVERAIAESPRARAAVVWLPDGAPDDAPALLLPAAALASLTALARLLAGAAPAVLVESRATGAPVVSVDAAVVRALAPRLADGAPLGDALAAVLASGVRALDGGEWFVRVRDTADARRAQEQLFAAVGSPIDTRLDRLVHRRLSRPVSRLAVACGIGPNPITLLSAAAGAAAAWYLWGASPLGALAGLLLYLVAVVLDHSDGEVARLGLSESALGEWLDIGADTVVHASLVIAMGVTTGRVADGMGAVTGAVAAVGVVASAALAKISPVITPRQGGDRFGRLLAGLGNRDGYYVMLIAFVVALSALPAALPFLMGLVAAGSHAYWLGRAAYALRRR